MAIRTTTLERIICDGCGEGAATEASEERYYAIEDRYYFLELCTRHAQSFDRDMLGWAERGQPVDSPYHSSSVFDSVSAERIIRRQELAERAALRELEERREARAAAERAEQLRQASADAEQRQRREQFALSEDAARNTLPGALNWTISTHAYVRMAQRGFPVYEVLNTAVRPEHTYPQEWRGPEIFIYQRGMCRLAVNAVERVIITVIDRDDELEKAPAEQLAKWAEHPEWLSA